MPRPANLSNLSVDALIKMRNDISGILSSKAALLRKELAYLGETDADTGREMIRGLKNGTKLGKVAPKYRGPDGETWAGRGGIPVWMKEALKKGKKREDFLIDKSARPAKTKNGAKKGKRGRPRKVA